MARYIDADRAVQRLKDAVVNFKLRGAEKSLINNTIEYLQSQPTADVVEVKHGHWKKS